MVTVYYILFISNFICTLTNIKNKFLVNVTTISLALLFIASNGEIGDSILYKEAFEYREDSNAYGFEIGYRMLTELFHFIDIWDYNIFLIFVFLLTVFNIRTAFRRMGYLIPDYHCVFFVIMPFIFPTCTEAIRFALALSFVIQAIQCLLENKPTRFLINIILSGCIHRICLFYLIFILCLRYKTTMLIRISDSLIRFSLYISLLLSIILLTPLRWNIQILIMKICYGMFPTLNYKILAYLNSDVNLGPFLIFTIYCINIIFANKVYSKIRNFEGNIKLVDDMLVILKINYLLGITLPLISLNLVFYRLLMVGNIINCLLYSTYKYLNSKHIGQQMLKITKDMAPTNNKYILNLGMIDIILIVSSLIWFIPESIALHSISIKNMIEGTYLSVW